MDRGPTTTRTRTRLKKTGRKFFGMEKPDGTEIDKLSITVEPVIIKKIYPQLHLAEVVLRDNTGAPPFDVQIVVPLTELIGNMPPSMSIKLYNTTVLTEPKTLRKYVKPTDTLVGSVLAIKGDYTGNGGILLGMMYMHGEGPLALNIPTEYNFTMGESSIVISDGKIEIDSPEIWINGELIDFTPQ